MSVRTSEPERASHPKQRALDRNKDYGERINPILRVALDLQLNFLQARQELWQFKTFWLPV